MIWNWDTPREGNCYEMGQDYPVWDTGGVTMGQGVWCMEAARMSENLAVVGLEDGRQELWRIDPGHC